MIRSDRMDRRITLETFEVGIMKSDGATGAVTDGCRLLKLIACLVLLFCAGLSAASSVADPVGRIFVDNIPLGTVGHVKYSNVDVEITSDGTVYIRTNKGSVVTDGTPNTPDTGGKSVSTGVADSSILEPQKELSADERALKGRYWLVAQDLGTQPSGWTALVVLNGQTIGEFASGVPKVIEVTSMLRKGENVARIDFRRATSDQSASASANDSLQIILAPGKVAEDQEEISLGYPIIVQQRNATETQAAPEDLRFVLPPPILP